MKKILLLLVLFAGANFVQAQKASEKTFSEACACVKKVDRKLNSDLQTTQAIGCIYSAVEKNITGLQKEYNIQTGELEDISQELATKLGMSLISQCPEVLPYLMDYAQKQQQLMDEDRDTLK